MEKLEDEQGKQHKRVRTAAQTAVLMAILTLVSKLFGFVREMVMAGCFGTSYVVDAYVMAQSIPSIIFAGIFGAVATSYMPLFSAKMEKQGQKEGNRFTSKVITILFIASAVSAIVGIIFSDEITALLASGFTGETARLTSNFLKVTFVYVMFTSTAGVFEAYLQYKSVFIPQIVIGYTKNLIVIGTIIFSAYFSYYYLAFGLLIAYMIRLALMWCYAKKQAFKYYLDNRGTSDVIKQIAILALPVFLGSSVSQINLFVDKYLASGLSEGSVSALNYANILNTMVMSLSITILTTMIYPKLAQATAASDMGRFNWLLQRGFNLIIIIAVPFSLGAMVYNEQIVQIVFERGAFDISATALTGSAYLFYSIGMVFMALNTLFMQAYYSMHDTKGPMIYAAIGVIINIMLNLSLIGIMQHNGLALATSIAAGCNTLLMGLGLKKKYTSVKVIESSKKVVLITFSAVVAVAISYLVYFGLSVAIWLPRMIYLAIAVMVAIVIYLTLLFIFRFEEIGLIKDCVKERKVKV